MTVTESLLTRHRAYSAEVRALGGLAAKGTQKVAVVACMDSRLDVFAVLGLTPGDAHVIRNAGGIVTEDTIRSLAISQHLLGTEEIILSPEDAPLGQQVLEGANAQGRHFRLSAEQRPTGGGLILKQGSVECSCTFPEILRQLRQEMSGEVAAILFD